MYSTKKDYDDSFHEMGNSLRNLGRLKDAIFYYKTALEINPGKGLIVITVWD